MIDAKQLLSVVLSLRERAAAAGRDADVRYIDAALAGDIEAVVRGQVGTRHATPAEFRLLVKLEAHRQKFGFSPTMGELAKAMKVSKVTVFGQLHQLKERGIVEMERYQMRSARLTASPCIQPVRKTG